jgi:hypothetical protein
MNQAKIKLSAGMSSDMEENTVESDHVEKQIGQVDPRTKLEYALIQVLLYEND